MDLLHLQNYILCCLKKEDSFQNMDFTFENATVEENGKDREMCLTKEMIEKYLEEKEKSVSVKEEEKIEETMNVDNEEKVEEIMTTADEEKIEETMTTANEEKPVDDTMNTTDECQQCGLLVAELHDEHTAGDTHHQVGDEVGVVANL